MVDLDPEIWNTPRLGEATFNKFADEIQAQAIEDEAAKREGRPRLIARRIHRYPGSQQEVSIANSYDDGMRWYMPSELPENDPDYEPASDEIEVVNYGDPENVQEDPEDDSDDPEDEDEDDN